MDYEKKYNEALERARAMYESRDDAELAAFIFPELAESDDERIRKQLIDAITMGRANSGISFTEEAASMFIAWLEKHSEKEIQKICKEEYTNGFNDAAGFGKQKEQRPLKVGENAYFDPNTQMWFIKKEQEPVEWNANDKAFIKDCARILNENGYEASAERLLSMFEQKQEWSEEDEEILESTIDDLERYKKNYTGRTGEYCIDVKINWLKSLRPSWKPSEDEERLINTSISFLKDFADKGYENAVECIDWLKSKLNGNSGK